jgi:hypothetical protein
MKLAKSRQHSTAFTVLSKKRKVKFLKRLSDDNCLNWGVPPQLGTVIKFVV